MNWRTISLLVLLVVVLPTGSTAEKAAPLIFNAVPDGLLLVIEGEDLVLDDDQPVVTLGDQELLLKDFSSEERIEAYLPDPPLPSGTYLLTVSPGQDSRDLGIFEVAIEFSLSSHDHDSRYYTETEMQTSGASILHWDNLIALPDGLDDGDDVGTYLAGNQLLLEGSTFNVIEGPGSGLDADTVDGLHANEIATAQENILTVAKSEGQFTSIQAAIDSISDNSASNRYLIRVAPGIYDEKVIMKPYVSVEGSGEGVTKVTSTGGTSNTTSGLTVKGTESTELRFLTVENTGGDLYAIAIHSYWGSMKLLHVTALASGGYSSRAVMVSGPGALLESVTAISSGGGSTSYGIYNDRSEIFANGLTVEATGGTNSNNGIFSLGETTTLEINNARIHVYGSAALAVGIRNQESTAAIRNSVVIAKGATTNYGIYNSGSGGPREVHVINSKVQGTQNSVMHDNNYRTRLAGSMLAGGPVDITAGGSAICAGVYDETYSFFADACP